MKQINKSGNGFTYQILSFLFFIICLNPAKSQVDFNWGLDVFALDVCSHLTMNIDQKVSLGIEGELGVNFSHFVVAGGSHFNNGKYYGPAGFGLFTRILNKTKFPIDIGYKSEYFIHIVQGEDAGGKFNGVFMKIFWPTKFKEKDLKKKRKMSAGVRLSFGSLKEKNKNRSIGLLADLWLRFYLNYN